MRYRRKDGGEVWAEVSMFAVPAAGSTQLLSTIAADITERKRTEEALRKTQADLAHVARLTTMGELMASIVHEINQPLAAISTDAKACLRWLCRDKPDLEETRAGLVSIERQVMRAGDVTRGLRALAKGAGPQLSEVDLNDAIEEVLILARSELLRHGVVLHTNLIAGRLPIYGDRFSSSK